MYKENEFGKALLPDKSIARRKMIGKMV